VFVLLTSAGIIIAAAVPSPAPSFFSSQLFGIIIGGVISAAVSFAGSWIIHKQQQQRDRDAYDRQVEREELAHKRQIEREQAAYARTLNDEKRVRLRSAYKVILNAAEEYEAAIQQLNFVSEGETEETRNKRLNASLHKALEGMNEAMIEITLEGVGEEAKTIFRDMRLEFDNFTSKLSYNGQYHGAFSWEEIKKHQNAVPEKVRELTTCMKKYLKELEQ
jgi:mannitol-specific phosphotransferase system IIBC component